MGQHKGKTLSPDKLRSAPMIVKEIHVTRLGFLPSRTKRTPILAGSRGGLSPRHQRWSLPRRVLIPR